MPSRAVTNFMRQQGFALEPPDACDMHFEGLYFQPRIVFPTVIVAILLQIVSIPLSAGLHFLISAVLWWNTLLPALNPFELAYNRGVARPKGRLELEGADGALLHVEIPRDRHESLSPKLGERLYLRPRRVSVFLDA